MYIELSTGDTGRTIDLSFSGNNDVVLSLETFSLFFGPDYQYFLRDNFIAGDHITLTEGTGNTLTIDLDTDELALTQLTSENIDVQDTIKSNNFDTGVDGWEIDSNGNFEVNNITVRGIITDLYSVDSTVTDQGAVTANKYRSVKDLAVLVGTAKYAIIHLTHNPSDGNTTTYTWDTSLDLTSYPKLFFKIDPGVMFARTTGDEIFTIYSPQNVFASPNQLMTDVAMINFGAAGFIPDRWFSSAFAGSMPEGTALEFSDGDKKWIIESETPSYINNDSVLALSISGSPLRLYLADDPSGGGTRLYLWDKTTTLPILPHTGLRPTMAVYGDILIGDIMAIASNPMTYFMRVETGLAETAITQLFSAQKGSEDTDGGATIVYAPIKNAGGAVNDGYISLNAFGKGSGALANSIRFSNRSGVDTITERWVIDGVLNNKGDLKPSTDDTHNIGSALKRVKNLFANCVTTGKPSHTFYGGTSAEDGNALVAGSTIFIGPTGAHNNLTIVPGFIVPNTGTLTQIRVQLSAAPGTGENIAFTLFQNGISTAMKFSIIDTAFIGVTTTNPVNLNTADKLALRAISSGSAASVSVSVSFLFVAT